MTTKWVLVLVLAIGLVIVPLLSSFSIRVLGLQWVTPLLMTLWFAYGVWFLLTYGLYRR
jgi:hypothetical protein